ncbi:hypothetical protein KUTeg_019435, partial [Tegillarca granosa]
MFCSFHGLDILSYFFRGLFLNTILFAKENQSIQCYNSIHIYNAVISNTDFSISQCFLPHENTVITIYVTVYYFLGSLHIPAAREKQLRANLIEQKVINNSHSSEKINYP